MDKKKSSDFQNGRILNLGYPTLTYRKQIRVSVSCPNCQEQMHFDPGDVDLGNIVSCEKCKTKTYYPFEKPWYKKTKLVICYILSLIVTFLLGLLTNFISNRIENRHMISARVIEISGERR